SESADALGPVLGHVAADTIKLNEAIGGLLKFSFVRRNPDTKSLSIHRLVQAILKDKMNKRTKRQWAERAVKAVSQAFPHSEFENWQRCQRYLSQALACAALIEQWRNAWPEAAQLLNEAGDYLRERGQYTQAEPLL